MSKTSSLVSALWWRLTNWGKLKCSAGWSWDNGSQAEILARPTQPTLRDVIFAAVSRPASQAGLATICPDWVCWGATDWAPDNQQSYGPSPSWRLFALWALLALLPIKILTCWHAWMLGSAGRSSYWKMPDILVKYANTNAQISCQTKRASCRTVGFNWLMWVNLGSVICFY